MPFAPTRVEGGPPSGEGATPADPFEARIGEIIGGKWVLEGVLGVGGMAAVFSARHRIAGNRVAVKILHPEVARVTQARERFVQEAEAVARLGHPGVVGIVDVDVTERGESYLVMERLEGESLAERKARQPLSLEEVSDIADRVLDVLVAAHAAQIIHRDIKPDNVFLTSGGDVKVLDFGVARVRAASVQRVRTATGTAMGTVSYAPPEQLKGVDVDHRADLFSLGATVFELLSGRPIHQANNEQQLLFKMMSEPAPAVRSVAPNVPEPLGRVVDCALSFEASGRYPDAATMRDDLRAVRQGQPPPFASRSTATLAQGPVAAQTFVDSPKRTGPAGPADRSHALLALVAAGVLGALVVAAVIVAAVLHGSDADDTARPGEDLVGGLPGDEPASSPPSFPAGVGEKAAEEEERRAEKAAEEEEKRRAEKAAEEEKRRAEKAAEEEEKQREKAERKRRKKKGK